MDDEKILERGGSEYEINQYANINGADMTKTIKDLLDEYANEKVLTRSGYQTKEQENCDEIISQVEALVRRETVEEIESYYDNGKGSDFVGDCCNEYRRKHNLI